jgi:prepilin-type processing-associated H-X9-DG protein
LGVGTGTTKDHNDFYFAESKKHIRSKEDVRRFRNGMLIPNQKADYFGGSRLKTIVTFADCRDGSSNTLLIGESIFDTSEINGVSRGIDHWYIGSYQVDYNIEMSEFLGSTAVELNLYHRYRDAKLEVLSDSKRTGLNKEMAFGFASWHAGDVVNFTFADGSTRLLAADVDSEVYANLGNRSDGKSIPAF